MPHRTARFQEPLRLSRPTQRPHQASLSVSSVDSAASSTCSRIDRGAAAPADGGLVR
jgi:hypothetical protein